MISDIDWARIAMAVDGEGTIALCRSGKLPVSKRQRFYPRIQVSNTDRRLLEWIRERFGGSISSPRKRAENHRQGYCWQARLGDCPSLLQGMRDWLIIKGEQADVCLEYYSGALCKRANQYQPITDEEWERRAALWERVHTLNCVQRPPEASICV